MKFYFRRIFQGDLVIWIVFFLLCMISLVEVFSAASSLSYKTGDFLVPLFKQAAFLAAGTAVVWFFHALPCRYFKIIPVFFLPICVILLILTLFFGVRTNEGARWLYILGIRFQPAELAKGVVIITTALILACWQREEGADRRAMKWILVSSGVVCLLIFSENLSTAVILFGTVFLMMFLGRVPLIQLGKIVAFFVALILGAVLLVETLPKETLNDVPGLHRIDTWVARLTDHTSDVENDTVFLAEHPQEAHANIAIASSNFIGKGPGNSEQRDHLAQAYSDFIYAIIAEELGLWGAILVVFLYMVLLVRAGRIASRCERNFPAFLIMGLALLLVNQALINMLVAVGLVPVTGQPLPLISRGGTSTLINCVYFGMMISVSRYAKKKPKKSASAPADAPKPDAVEQTFQSNEGLV